jgi:hypothetical protein
MGRAGSQTSPPFVDRELNGTLLLEELAGLKAAAVPQGRLTACERALRGLGGLHPAEAAEQLKRIALTDFAEAPALAQLLVRWASRIRMEGDAAALEEHFHRLAVTAALLGALWQAASRLVPRREQ